MRLTDGVQLGAMEGVDTELVVDEVMAEKSLGQDKEDTMFVEDETMREEDELHALSTKEEEVILMENDFVIEDEVLVITDFEIEGLSDKVLDWPTDAETDEGVSEQLTGPLVETGLCTFCTLLDTGCCDDDGTET